MQNSAALIEALCGDRHLCVVLSNLSEPIAPWRSPDLLRSASPASQAAARHKTARRARTASSTIAPTRSRFRSPPPARKTRCEAVHSQVAPARLAILTFTCSPCRGLRDFVTPAAPRRHMRNARAAPISASSCMASGRNITSASPRIAAASRRRRRLALQSAKGLYPDEGLARYEWRKHGNCSGKSPTGYFADVRRARDAVTIPPPFRAAHETQNWTPIDIERAFIAANPRLRPGMLAVECNRGELEEVRILLFQGSAQLRPLSRSQPALLLYAANLRAADALERDPQELELILRKDHGIALDSGAGSIPPNLSRSSADMRG